MMKEAARVEAKRVVVAEERGCRWGGMAIWISRQCWHRRG